MARPNPPPTNRILLVEGQDDKHVVLHLCKQHQAALSFFFSDPDRDDSQGTVSDQAVSIRDTGNIDKVLESIVSEIKAPGRQAVGILVDANDNKTGRWEAIQGRLQRANIDPPQSPSPDGTIIRVEPRIGIWLMPANTLAGELEDFVVKMIPEGDQVWPLSQRYIEEIPEGERKFSDGKTLRAQLYAWLATREDPRRMGLAIRAQDLKVDGTLSQKFVAWLNNLFG